MDVYVMVLESDGAHLGAAMTAASAALADAACELCDLVPACHVVRERRLRIQFLNAVIDSKIHNLCTQLIVYNYKVVGAATCLVH